MPPRSKKDKQLDLDENEPILTSSPRVGKMPRSGRSSSWRQTTLNMSMDSNLSIDSHFTDPVNRDMSPSRESVASSIIRTCPLRERDINIEDSIFAVPAAKPREGELTLHPAQLSRQQQAKKETTQKRRGSGAANKSSQSLDWNVDNDEYEEDEPKTVRRRLISMNARPGRKAIGRRPNMDENILKKIQIPPFTKEDPFELIKKTRERILGDCIQNFFKVYIGANNQWEEVFEINSHYRNWV